MKQGSGTARQSRGAKFKIPDSRRDLRKISTFRELVVQRGGTAMPNSRFQIQEEIFAKYLRFVN
jgi:hypothetical protein